VPDMLLLSSMGKKYCHWLQLFAIFIDFYSFLCRVSVFIWDVFNSSIAKTLKSILVWWNRFVSSIFMLHLIYYDYYCPKIAT
jgi:hypothetical protein